MLRKTSQVPGRGSGQGTLEGTGCRVATRARGSEEGGLQERGRELSGNIEGVTLVCTYTSVQQSPSYIKEIT